jgi:hypothetical protein
MTMAQPCKFLPFALYFVSILREQSLGRSPGHKTHLDLLKDEATDPRKDGKSKAEDTSSAASVENSNQPLKV